jgi:uncharacterized protein (DUF427 family)
MPRFLFKGVALAGSELCHIVEGNYCCPSDAVDYRYLLPSDAHSACRRKGIANYYHVLVDGKTIANAAWYYPDPLPAASKIKEYMTFWKATHRVISSHRHGS